ncbi:MAG: trehalose-phosphatase [Gemmatimonadetes bacterium]|nr:trehalose-phosphatase [Gemmatimonadota bacterium]
MITHPETASHAARTAVQSPVLALQRNLATWLAWRPTLALFLDYDGTLISIAERPDHALLSDAAREALVNAARAPNLDVVIVSGRALADLQARIGISGLTYVGNHGFEIEGPGLSGVAPDVKRFHGNLARAAHELEELRVEGGWVERKGPTLSYHLRQVARQGQPGAARRARAILRRHGLRVLVGNAIVEGSPPIEWHKGAAVLHVLGLRYGADWISRVRALYLGDDATDEDAFRSLKSIGRSVCVTPGEPAVTLADYCLPDPAHVVQLVGWLGSGGFQPPG